MTTATKLQEQEELLTALYCRLSVDDIKEDAEENESNSIKNQDGICQGGFLQKRISLQKSQS